MGTMISILKNNLNIFISLIVMLFTGAFIVKSGISEYGIVKGYIEEVNCQVDKKRDGIYLYHIKLVSDVSFRNRLDVACNVVSELKKGDYIEIESNGHIFIQVKHNGIDLFNKKLLDIKRSGVNLVFVLLFILASCDFSYRIYLLNKNSRHQK